MCLNAYNERKAELEAKESRFNRDQKKEKDFQVEDLKLDVAIKVLMNQTGRTTLEFELLAEELTRLNFT